MAQLPVVVVLSKDIFFLMSELIDEEKERIVSSVKSEALTEEQFADKTRRLNGLVDLLGAMNEGARTTIEMARELKEQGQ